MNKFAKTTLPSNFPKQILALGAESAGNFAVYQNGEIYHSEDFGDLLDEKNFADFQKAILDFLKKKNFKPEIILTDLHPEMKTTLWGQELAKKLKAKHFQIQHHHAHIFSQLPILKLPPATSHRLLATRYTLSLDGTGYGTDGKIWGGECFRLQATSYKLQANRIAHLENQTMIGGDLAIREPARMLISILAKIKSNKQDKKTFTSILRSIEVSSITNESDFRKNLAYHFVKKYYSKNQFELLYNQLQQNFNCQETSSAGRVLDAVAVLLGFAKNERKYKHQATDLLEKNSTKPYLDLKPKITETQNSKLDIDSKFEIRNSKFTLNTTYLFEYLIKNLHRDKKRLAATAQLYIAQGLHEIIKKHQIKNTKKRKTLKTKSFPTSILRSIEVKKSENFLQNVILSGGISNNKIIYDYFQSKNILANSSDTSSKAQNKKTGIPLGDAGLSVGQIVCYLFENKKV